MVARGWISLVLVPILSALACASSSDGSGAQYACHYTSSVSTICSGYSNNSNDPGCIAVSSQSECNDYTKSSTDCTGGCCTDTSYSDVSMVPGSCSSTSGTGGSGGGGSGGTGGGGTGGGGSMCAPASGDVACTTCFKANCCSQLSACDASQDCVNLVNCINQCASGDNACIQSCENSYPNGVTPLDNLGACINSSCSTQCN